MVIESTCLVGLVVMWLATEIRPGSTHHWLRMYLTGLAALAMYALFMRFSGLVLQ